MTSIPHALSGWWRYSELNGYGDGGALVVAGMLWLDVLLRHALSVAIVCAAVFTIIALVRVGHGAVRAQRARRYGCW